MKIQGRVVERLQAALHCDLAALLSQMREQGLSASQMHDDLTRRSGVVFNKRQLERWLETLCINFSRDEAGRQRWRDGLMNEGARKTRLRLRETMIKGSRIEDQLRWALKNELERPSEYETIIGFTDWTILDNLEVDIPIVCIRKSDQRIVKFAIEVDGYLFHPDDSRWIRKQTQMRQAGWHPLRVVIGPELSRKAHQVYIKGNIRALADISSIVSEIQETLNSQPPPVHRTEARGHTV